MVSDLHTRSWYDDTVDSMQLDNSNAELHYKLQGLQTMIQNSKRNNDINFHRAAEFINRKSKPFYETLL